MTPNPDGPSALALVHEGWDHLKHERPLAAWASWRRALRIEPDQTAARLALERLANAAELPESARKEYRFRTPPASRRGGWDAAFRGRDLADLDVAASAFAGLAADDPADPDAPYNQGLCLAWLGRNAEAIEALDRSVRLGAESDFDGSVAAWTLAGIIRQGGGAEGLADEFRHAIEGEGDPADLLEDLGRLAVLRRLPAPAEATRDDVTVDEWLDRDWPEPEAGNLRLDDMPRVGAIVIANGRGVRFSTPSASGAEVVLGVLRGLGHDAIRPARTPLPLALLDADVWTIRLPTWVDDATRARLHRENVEDFFEDRWVGRPRRGLDGSTPVEASRGDPASRAKLAATIGLFEELAGRPASVELYQGYPFDRLRRRLGLPIRDEGAVDPLDPGSMSGADLDRLDPDALDGHALADAFRSASSLGDDARTARFAGRLVATRPPSLAGLDLRDVFAPLVRLALDGDRPDEALRRVDEAIALDESIRAGRGLDDFTAWRGAILARSGAADDALATYRSLADRSDAPASVALDGAETLLDAGHPAQARRLAELARDLALNRGDVAAGRSAEDFVDQIPL